MITGHELLAHPGAFTIDLVVGCAQATEEDRRALIGKWLPQDGAKGHVEFKPDGVFDYFHGMATLRLGWKPA